MTTIGSKSRVSKETEISSIVAYIIYIIYTYIYICIYIILLVMGQNPVPMWRLSLRATHIGYCVFRRQRWLPQSSTFSKGQQSSRAFSVVQCLDIGNEQFQLLECQKRCKQKLGDVEWRKKKQQRSDQRKLHEYKSTWNPKDDQRKNQEWWTVTKW